MFFELLASADLVRLFPEIIAFSANVRRVHTAQYKVKPSSIDKQENDLAWYKKDVKTHLITRKNEVYRRHSILLWELEKTQKRGGLERDIFHCHFSPFPFTPAF